MQVHTRNSNRVVDYFEEPLPAIPDHPHDRQDMLAETVLQAVQAMRGLLRNSDKAIVLRAAEAILSLEQTRIRHGSNVIGCRAKMIPDWESRKEMEECLNDPGPPKPEHVERDAEKAHAAEARRELVQLEAAKPADQRKTVSPNAGHVFVKSCLKKWNASAASIPVGRFWQEFLERDVDPLRAKSRSESGTLPAPSSVPFPGFPPNPNRN